MILSIQLELQARDKKDETCGVIKEPTVACYRKPYYKQPNSTAS